MQSANPATVDAAVMPETRQRLLEAAGEIFADQGFKCATVREICARAGANVAAVNYHFGDKQGLYSETLRYWVREAMTKYPPNLGVTDGTPAEEKLAAYVKSFLFRLTDQGRPAWYGRLIAREMFEPTHALDERINETMKPLADLLKEIVRELLGPGGNEDDIRRLAGSVTGQITFYHHCRPVLERIYPGQDYTPEGIEKLATHITRFSLAGIREVGRKG